MININTLSEIPAQQKNMIRLLKQIPEYQEATRNNPGPRKLNGSADQRTIKVVVAMTGGTS